MASAAHDPVCRVYHQPLWGRTDPELRRCLAGAGVVGLLTLLVIFLAPARAPDPVTIEHVPERLARLILEKPQQAATPARPAPRAPVQAPVAAPAPAPVPAPQASSETPRQPRPAARRTPTAPPPADAGRAGRERAHQEVTQNLAAATTSLDQALDQLAAALPAAQEPDAAAAGRRGGRTRREVRSGRSATELGTVGGTVELARADLGGSTLVAEGLSIGEVGATLAAPPPSGAGDAGGTGAAGAPAGEVRSNESLLAVVRRYAPAIQFCYENELKKNPGLRGKLVVSLTVTAAGAVTDARVVEDGLGAPAVTGCSLAQIRGWQFPPVPAGATTFQVPFLFTPPL